MIDLDAMEEQAIIIEYLAEKLHVGDDWYTAKQDFLFDCTPEEIFIRGDGPILIQWLEERLGLRQGEAF